MKIILLNGPPGCGKDFAAHALMLHYCKTMSLRWERFSRPNKHAFAGTMGLHTTSGGMAPDTVPYYEAHKEEPIPAFGVSYRQWQIDFSEKFMKPLYGPEIFAKLFLERNKVRLSDANWLCVVSDCGFQIEYETVMKVVDPKDVLLIRLEREGHSFAGDSREYVEPIHIHLHYRLINNGGPDVAGTKYDFTSVLIETAKDWLGS